MINRIKTMRFLKTTPRSALFWVFICNLLLAIGFAISVPLFRHLTSSAKTEQAKALVNYDNIHASIMQESDIEQLRGTTLNIITATWKTCDSGLKLLDVLDFWVRYNCGIFAVNTFLIGWALRSLIRNGKA